MSSLRSWSMMTMRRASLRRRFRPQHRRPRRHRLSRESLLARSAVAPPAAKTPQIPLEPWYYSFLEVVGAGIMFLGVIGCLLGLLYGLEHFTFSRS